MDNNVMFKISYGLFVLTSADDDSQSGCIINTALQVTATPNRIAVTVNKSNFTHSLIETSGVFNVSVIDESAPFDFFRHFGFRSGKTVEKINSSGMAKYAPNYIAYIAKHTNAYISGKVVDTVDLGTHTMFIADVTDGEILSSLPSMTYDYYHQNVKPKPQPQETHGWKCKICGYVYNGDELPEDFVCPLCKHGASDFEKIN